MFKEIRWCFVVLRVVIAFQNFQESLKIASRKLPRVFQLCLKGCLKNAWNLFHGCVQEVSTVFSDSLEEVVFYNFVTAWHSSQLPKQKKGLLQCERVLLSLG